MTPESELAELERLYQAYEHNRDEADLALAHALIDAAPQLIADARELARCRHDRDALNGALRMVRAEREMFEDKLKEARARLREAEGLLVNARSCLSDFGELSNGDSEEARHLTQRIRAYFAPPEPKEPQ